MRFGIRTTANPTVIPAEAGIQIIFLDPGFRRGDGRRAFRSRSDLKLTYYSGGCGASKCTWTRQPYRGPFMCGICGIVDFTKTPDRLVVQEMNARLSHRGPDMDGMCEFPTAVLGHRRLSILDLSEGARQPMLSDDGHTALVFNGEIYNFQALRKALDAKGNRFHTTSDTEVILRLYLEEGEALVEHLNGMFSIALWDDKEKKLFLARDRLGKKPLYYSYRGGRLTFSSELFPLLEDPAVPRDLWEQALAEYLLYDFVPAPHTIFKGVYKLPAAHKAVFDANGLRIQRYWTPPEPEEGPDYEKSKMRLLELLEDAVRIRLVSDVPLGAFLSGGIDSTFVTALMTRNCAERVKTFSIAFPGTTHDESAWSRMAATSLGTQHRETPVEYDIERIFPAIVRHFAEPFGDSSAIPTWHLSETTRRQVTVALSGDGGDELFGGYERYLARRYQLLYDRLPGSLRRGFVEPLIEQLPATTHYYGVSLSKKLKLFVDAARRMTENPFAVIPRTFSMVQLRNLARAHYNADADPTLATAQRWAGLDPVSRMLFTDMQTYMVEDILTKVDRMSMAHSLEVRSPLLDYRVVEFACRLPLDFKLKGRTTKRILKDTAQGYVPQPILKRSKYGFQVPLGEWLKGALRPWAQERLLDSDHGFFKKRPVEALWKEHQEGRTDHAHRIWLILVFNEWWHQLQKE